MESISEAELIEIENRAKAIETAECLITKRIAKLEGKRKDVPYHLETDLRCLEKLRCDIRLLIALVRQKNTHGAKAV